ncbi:hypothetical protein [Paracoccus fontiphilus]|uniref:Uncharacterized protein n=1 Tax=Paracoccus fontiphilus TaxID=1815556 RepID=A0ABV7I7H6_9RHOB|nr:hypothetical protein [Paracoccus fontiphilus]
MIRHLAVLALLAAPVQAQQIDVKPYGDAERVDAIAEPWEDNIATYANGDIRLALLDMVEPAGGALKLVVISPPRDELGFRQCRVIGADGMGFYGLDFAARQANYHPQRGLTLTMPAKHHTDLAPKGGDYRLSVTIDQQSGRITTEVRK